MILASFDGAGRGAAATVGGVGWHGAWSPASSAGEGEGERD